MKHLLSGTAAALLLLMAVLAFNTWRGSSVRSLAPSSYVTLDVDGMARRLSAAISISTLSPGTESASLDEFARLHSLLERQFPRTHSTLTREHINHASLLYRWEGRFNCAPLLLAAHQDVVPVEAGTEAGWKHPPFAGVIDATHVWGRGAIDDKGSLLAILEAVEHLLAEGFVPACPIYLAFGHDEETGGRQGAAAIARLLQQRGVAPAFVLDEGGALTQGTLAGLAAPLATIGVAEKGYLSLRLEASSSGGHSSMPPRATAIGVLAAAVARLEQQRPAAQIGAVQRELLARVAPQLPMLQRVMLSNLWLTAPLVKAQLASSPVSDATLRTTTAPTLLRAGVKDNVLPQHAEAVINFRIQPGDSIESVLAHVRDTIDDPRITVQFVDGFSTEPTATARWDNSAFALLERALRQVSPEPDLVVAPYVTSGATDARHYAVLTPNLYRFAPFRMLPDELDGLHGSNERIALAEYQRGVRFYIALLQGFGP